jgi:hypothetical protein
MFFFFFFFVLFSCLFLWCDLWEKIVGVRDQKTVQKKKKSGISFSGININKIQRIHRHRYIIAQAVEGPVFL